MNNKDKMPWIRRIAIFIVLVIVLQLATLSGGSVAITGFVVNIVISAMACGLVSEFFFFQFITALIVGIFFIILFPKLRKVIGERWE